MADTKISGLPASTTPLAGTEVLPIVQSGTTKQVSVANLTAGRDVSANIFSSAAGAVATPAITTAGDTNTGFWFPAADTIAASTAGTERMRIASNGVISLGAAVNSESLRVTPVASAVNFLEINGAVTSANPYIYANGSDSTTSMDLVVKGAGAYTFFADSGTSRQFQVARTASAVNYLQATGAATGNNPVLSAQGTDTNIDLALTPKGTGGLTTKSSGQSTASLSTTTFGGSIGILDSGGVVGAGGAVVFGALSGSWRFAAIKSFVTSSASNTQGDLYFLTRRNATDATLTPAMQITSGGVISLGAASGSESLRVTPTASAVNYVSVFGAATGQTPTISPQGSDTNIPLGISSKGTSALTFYTNAFGNIQFNIANTASAVNYLQVAGSATGNAVTMSATGSDTNIDLALTPKGTGVVQYGTYTAGIIAQAGYITIKDAGGTTRRLLVG